VLATRSLLFLASRGGRRGGDAPIEPAAIQALDKATGRLIWRTDLPRGPVSSPMTYLHQGRQFIAMAVGAGSQAEIVAYALPASAVGRAF